MLFLSLRPYAEGKFVLELGAGCGLAGNAAAAAGAAGVLLTDIPEAVPHLRANAEENARVGAVPPGACVPKKAY